MGICPPSLLTRIFRMEYDFWREVLQLNAQVKALEAEDHQGTAYNPTSQPHQSLHTHQYSDTTLVVSEHQATYDGYATTNHYSQALHHDLTDPGQSQPNIGSNATEQPPCNVCSNYHHYACFDCPAAHNLGLSNTNLTTESSFTSVQGFHHYQLQEEPHSINDHKSESRACKWFNGHDLCGRTIDANKVSEHMCEYHLRSLECADHPVYCQWEGCRRSPIPYRRDTITRHVREFHLRISRPKSSASVNRDTGARLRRSRKKAHTN